GAATPPAPAPPPAPADRQRRPAIYFEPSAGHRTRGGRLQGPPAERASERRPGDLMQGLLLADRYLLGEPLGSGGAGHVYRATDLRTGGPVAVKLLHPLLARDRPSRERLRREAHIAARLTSPRIVRVIDLVEGGDTPFLVLEYVAGETLEDVLRRRGRLPVEEALRIALEVAQALEAAHAA